MVARAVILSIASLVLLGSADAGLQLTPRVVNHELDGAKFKRLAFPDGGNNEITYIPPAGWEYVGSATRLALHPRNKSQAEGTVTKVSLPEPASFDEESLEKLALEAMGSLPLGSTNVALASQQKNPVFIGGKETILVTVSYTSHGEKFGRSLMILNRGKEQIRFQLVSRLEDFAELQSAFLNSHFGWENL